jgi:hypothetical protein
MKFLRQILTASDVLHPKITIIIEACEESGSLDLPYYMQKLSPKVTSCWCCTHFPKVWSSGPDRLPGFRLWKL